MGNKLKKKLKCNINAYPYVRHKDYNPKQTKIFHREVLFEKYEDWRKDVIWEEDVVAVSNEQIDNR